MHVVTSAAMELWPKETPFWLISPGCKPDPKLQNDWNILGIIADPFSDGQRNLEAYDTIWETTEKLVAFLAENLNRELNETRSVSFWRIQLGFWAMNYITAILDRYRRLESARRQTENTIIVGAPTEDVYSPVDTLDFVYHIRDNDIYNSQMYALLSKKIGLEVITGGEASSSTKLEKITATRRSRFKTLISGLFRIVQNTLFYVFRRSARVILDGSYFPKEFQGFLFLRSFGRIISSDSLKSPTITYARQLNRAARERICLAPPNATKLEQLAISLVGNFLPRAFLESFHLLESLSKNKYKECRPPLIYSANSWYYDELFKHWAANLQLKGSKLGGGEHGGGPFVGRYLNYARLEIKISDFYFTWGWSDGEDAKIIPTPANILRR